MKLYTYAKCGTCRKAVKWLESRGIEVKEIPIRENPPSKAELKKMLGVLDGEIRKLFNTSGQDYRALNLKDTLPGMSEAEALNLLSGNGNLVKRPFFLTGDGGAVGFKEEEWRKLLGQ
ncbi:MAG: arsenate reductase family protein [Verrucomicrobiae bacterium]|nr:arsenate reductase family protein [Verrucomicrobiae bacterium]